MYDIGKGIAVVEKPSPERLNLLSYVNSVRSGDELMNETHLRNLLSLDQNPRGPR